MGHVAPVGLKEGVPFLRSRPIGLRRCRWSVIAHVLISHDVLSVKKISGARPAHVLVVIDPVFAQTAVPIALVLAHLAVRVLPIVLLHTEHVRLDQASALAGRILIAWLVATTLDMELLLPAFAEGALPVAYKAGSLCVQGQLA